MKQNKDKEAMLSHALLTTRYLYNPDTGQFYNIETPEYLGKQVGYKTATGYIGIEIRINGKGYVYLAHRLAWFYMTKSWPEHQIDHIDRDRQNNKWENLQLATAELNANNRKIRRDNQTGVPGISFDKNAKSCPYIVRYKGYFVGAYKTFQEAEVSLTHIKKLEQQGDKLCFLLHRDALTPRKNNFVGAKGITLRQNGNYQVRYRGKSLGTFSTLDEAKAVYQKAVLGDNQ